MSCRARRSSSVVAICRARAAPASIVLATVKSEDAARRAVPHLPGIHELKTAIAARLGMSEDNLHCYDIDGRIRCHRRSRPLGQA
jgi:hypothetical protein